MLRPPTTSTTSPTGPQPWLPSPRAPLRLVLGRALSPALPPTKGLRFLRDAFSSLASSARTRAASLASPRPRPPPGRPLRSGFCVRRLVRVPKVPLLALGLASEPRSHSDTPCRSARPSSSRSRASSAFSDRNFALPATESPLTPTLQVPRCLSGRDAVTHELIDPLPESARKRNSVPAALSPHSPVSLRTLPSPSELHPAQTTKLNPQQQEELANNL